MRASRLVSLLLLLQNRGRMTATQLAEELEVSVRTVYRDVDALLAAGIPLYGEPGHEGGYQLIEGYRTRLTGLSADEAGAMFLAALPGPAADLGLGAVMAAAQLKFMAALPAQLRTQAGRIQERFHLDAPGWYGDPDEIPHLPAVAGAVWNRRVIRVRYSRWKEPTEVERRLEPHGLVLKAGRWYVVAKAERTMRTYRVDQILEATDLGESFEPDPGFDLAEFWNGYLADFRARLYPEQAVIRLSPRAVKVARKQLSQAAAQAIEQAAAQNTAATTTDTARDAPADAPDGSDDWIHATVPIESVDHAHAEFLKLGADLEVLEPAELRRRIADSARALARLYAP
ncbi:MAG TPA: YafY family protein [Actinocrinis sp.]|nr:YafY family protein [Actinocrinis sp.]